MSLKASLSSRLLGKRSARRARKSPHYRRAALRLESLETRTVFAADPLFEACGQPADASAHHEDEVHVVFAPDTPADIIAAYENDKHGDEPEFDPFTFGDTDRWSRTVTNGSGLTQGDPTTIRWSIVPDGTPVNGYNGEPSAPSNLRAFLAGIYGSNPSSSLAHDQPWFTPFQQVFDRWSEVSGVTYVYEAADDGASLGSSASGVINVRGDVRISGHYIDGPSNILAYNFYPTVGDMVIDTGDTFYTNTSGSSLRLRNTLAHEAGHGLGLGHVSPTNGTKLMEPSISLGFDGPQADDILAVNRGYGDRLEKNGGNNTFATATSLGTSGTFSFDTLSIDDDSDIDWFKIAVGASSAISVTLTPTGSTYSSNGTTFNSLAQSDLALAIYGTNGTTLIASANINGAGVAETLNSINLPGSGTYYVRVTGSANAAQMYRLTGSVTNVAPSPEISILDGATDIADNTGAVSFGDVLVGANATKTFTVRNTGSMALTLANPTLPAGFTLTQGVGTTSLAAGATTTFVVSMNTASANSYSGMLSLTNNDADENPFNFVISGSVSTPAPEIVVLDGSTNIADGGAVSFGTVAVGANATKTFTVQNTGTSTLTLSPPTLPAGFTLSSGLGSTSLAAGASTTFTIRVETSAVATHSGSFSLANNDADENPFNFTLSATVANIVPIASDDFNRADSTTLGAPWIERAGNLALSSGTLISSYSSTSLATVSGTNAADVSFTGQVNLGTSGDATRNVGFVARWSGSGVGSLYWGGITYSGGQRVAEIWRAIGGGWTRLASANITANSGDLRFDVAGTSLKLYFNGALVASASDSNLTTGAVGALLTGRGANLDNYSATAPSTAVTAPEIAVLDGATDIADNSGAVGFGSVNVGGSSSKTFTVRNLGDANLSLGSISLPSGFTLTQGLGTTTLTPGAATTFIVSMNTSAAGTFSGSLSLANNDADENPFNFTISGTVNAITAPEIAVLDGATDIADNTGAVSFGSVNVGGSSSKTFTVRNLGDANLSLGSISLPSGFTLTQGLGTTTLTPGAATTFVVSMNTSAAGTFSGSLSLANNDADENPFNFTISGTVNPTAPTAAFSDNFNRPASSSLGANWTERAGNLAISNNELVNAGSSTSLATVNAITSMTDVVLTADVNLGTSGSSIRNAGVVARQSGSGVGSLYWGGLTRTGGQWLAEIWRATNGSWTRLSATNVGVNTGEIRFEVIGSSLKLYLNDSLVGNVTDTRLTSGRVGALNTYSGGRLDNFTVASPTAAIAPATASAQTQAAQQAQWMAALDYLMSQWGRENKR